MGQKSKEMVLFKLKNTKKLSRPTSDQTSLMISPREGQDDKKMTASATIDNVENKSFVIFLFRRLSRTLKAFRDQGH
jgi:hypothetical protein